MPTNKQLCHERYGIDHFREFVVRLIGGQRNGVKRDGYLCFPLYGQFSVDESGKKFVKPAITKTRYNTLISRNTFDSKRNADKARLRAWMIEEHLISGREEIERKAAFINRCPRIGNRRIGLFVLDVDNHTNLPHEHVLECQDRLSQVIRHPIYWEPSTSGSGLHGYLLLSWHANASNETIRSDIRVIESLLAQITADLSVRCNELRGMPHLIHEREIVDSGYGEWAKLPCPQSEGEMARFLEATSESMGSYEFIRLLSSYLSQNQAFSGGDAPQDIAPVSACDGNSGLSERCNTTVGSDKHKGIGVLAETKTHGKPSETCKEALASKKHKGIGVPVPKTSLNDLSGEADTFARTRGFIQLWRPRNPHATMEDAFQAYADAGLMIGNSDIACFKQSWDYSDRTFDPSQAGGQTGAERYLPQAHATVAARLGTASAEALEEEYRNRVSRYQAEGCSPSTISKLRILSQEKLAQTLSCIIYELHSISEQESTVGKKQIQALMASVYSVNLDNKEWRAMREWLEAQGIIEMTAEYSHAENKIASRCRKFRLLVEEHREEREDEAESEGTEKEQTDRQQPSAPNGEADRFSAGTRAAPRTPRLHRQQANGVRCHQGAFGDGVASVPAIANPLL